MKEPELRPKSLRWLAVVILLSPVLYIGFQFAMRWLACQRLAPIERLFTPGC